MPIGGDETLKKLRNALMEIGGDLDELGVNIDNLISLVDKVRGSK